MSDFIAPAHWLLTLASWQLARQAVGDAAACAAAASASAQQLGGIQAPLPAHCRCYVCESSLMGFEA